MIGGLGYASTFAGTGLALSGVAVAAFAARGRLRAGSVVPAALAVCISFGAAAALMIAALLTHDFSIAYVAQVGSRSTPPMITVASLWAALEGSILLWTLLLAGVAALSAYGLRGARDRDRRPGVLAVLLSVTAFFGLVLVGPGNPWRAIAPVPADGPGPNPLLADHPLMAFHPPLLYMGLVGLAVPFALTADALARDRLDARWLLLARGATLAAWIPLTLGLVAGAWWSYAVLGWGGYWAWDPVENVALLPWLTATAFLHSAMVGRRGGLLRGWNVGLVAASFLLTLFATMVTRSGVLQSVHAFTRSAIGPLFIGLLAAAAVGTVGLMLLRLPARSPGGHFGARARAILFNNLLLSAIALTVLIGTVFPLIAEALSATRLSVGAPYFERVVAPLAAGLLLLMGVGPSLSWGDWSGDAARDLAPAVAGASAVAVALALAGLGVPAVAGAAAAAFALGASLASAWRRAGRSLVSPARKGARAPGRRRALGGFVAHAGIGLLALAVVLSSAGRRDAQLVMSPGETADILGRRIQFVESGVTPGPNRIVLGAQLRIGADGTVAVPALSMFAGAAQAVASPAILSGPLDDLYITLLDADPVTGRVTLRVSIYPFVSWIWVAGGVLAAGGLLAAWPAGPGRLRCATAGDVQLTAVTEHG